MSAWKPGQVVTNTAGLWLIYGRGGETWAMGPGGNVPADMLVNPRSLVVIDPEDAKAVERLRDALPADWCLTEDAETRDETFEAVHAALREFANPTPPTEPTDPTARVEDRRENIWRLLADGDWVCTSGPDIGEYLEWSRLAAERGPLTIEVAS